MVVEPEELLVKEKSDPVDDHKILFQRIGLVVSIPPKNIEKKLGA